MILEAPIAEALYRLVSLLSSTSSWVQVGPESVSYLPESEDLDLPPALFALAICRYRVLVGGGLGELVGR